MEEFKKKLENKNVMFAIAFAGMVLILVLQIVSLFKMQKAIDLIASTPKTFLNKKPIVNREKFVKKDQKIAKKQYKKIPFSFDTQTSFNDENEFVITMGIPENTTMENIKIYIRNNIISINIVKDEKKEGENYSFQSSGMLSQSFSIPETNAKFKDLKTSIDGNKLTIIIPIIK